MNKFQFTTNFTLTQDLGGTRIMKKQTMVLDNCHNIKVVVSEETHGEIGGTISSDLGQTDIGELTAFDHNINGLEALILAHVCCGVNIKDPRYVKGINAAIEAIANNYGD